MGKIWNFLTLPFDLPVSPVWSWIGMAVIGFIAFIVAWVIAGRFGTDSAERKTIHWIVRFISFVMLWCISCCVIRVGILPKGGN